MSDLEEMKLAEAATEIAGRVTKNLMEAMQYPEFGMGSPTVQEVAKIMGKDQTFVREGIEKGWLPIGICKTTNGVRSFYISPKKLWEVTGYVWKGKAG